MLTLKTLFVVLLAAGPALFGGDLPTAIQAKFVKVLCAASGSPGKVACANGDFAGALGATGVTADPGSRVAWAASEGEVGKLKAAGKMVIVPKLEWLSKGGSIAVVEEEGKPAIYMHMGNISASGVTLADSVLKIGKRL
jgi:hypothetical protein